MKKGRADKLALPTTEVEARFWAQGLRYVAGLDEAGRGAWAGPVYAAAVVLPHHPEMVRDSKMAQNADALAKLHDVRDSKTLSPRKRAALAACISEVAIGLGIGRSKADEIDALGIVPATRLAMRRALEALRQPSSLSSTPEAIVPQALIIDALTLPTVPLPQEAFPYADARSLSVAAAGIMAKVARDQWMMDAAESNFPGYGFAQHKGYGTRQHREALDRLGVIALHRRSFRPIAQAIQRMRELA